MLFDKKLILELTRNAKTIIIDYFEFIFRKSKIKNQSLLAKVRRIIDSFKLELEYLDESGAVALCDAYESKIVLYESFFHLTKTEQMATIIHEYFHALSYNLSSEIKYSVIEEGMADLFTELVINYSLDQKTCLEDVKKELRYEGYYLTPSENGYLPCREFLKTLFVMAPKQEYQGIICYLFCNKDKFVDFFYKKSKLNGFLEFLETTIAENCNTAKQQYLDKIYDLIVKNFSQELAKINLNKLIDKCSYVIDNESPFYYCNQILQRYTFNRLKEKYLKEITTANFLKLARKYRVTLKYHGFYSEELNQVLGILYKSEPTKFNQVLAYVKNVSTAIGEQVLNDRLLRSKDKFKTIIKTLKQIDFEISNVNYLKYYDQKRKKSDKFLFLARILNNLNVDSCYYYVELLLSFNYNNLGEKDNSLLLNCINNFLKNNSHLTNDPLYFKCLNLINAYLNHIRSKFNDDSFYTEVRRRNEVVRVKLQAEYDLIKQYNLNDMEIITKLINDKRIDLYHNYFVKLLSDKQVLTTKSLIQKR